MMLIMKLEDTSERKAMDMHDKTCFLQEVQNEHRKSADSSPVIKLDSDDEAAQQPGSASASRKTRVLIVAQHVSLQPLSSRPLAPRVSFGTMHLMQASDQKCAHCSHCVRNGEAAETRCIAPDAFSACAGEHMPAGAAVHAGRCQCAAAEALQGLPADALGHQAACQREGQKRPCHWLHYRATSEISTLPEPA